MPTIKLKPEERDFILKECPVMEDDLIEAMENAAFLDGWYTFRLDQEWAEDFLGWMDACSSNEEDSKKLEMFQTISARVEKVV